MGSTPSQPQFPPQVPGLPVGERPSWFQGLVAAVSKEIKDSQKKAAAAADNAHARMNAVPASVEHEKALVDALKKQRDGCFCCKS